MACLREPAESLRNTFFRCHFTVSLLTSSVRAISLFDMPFCSSCRISDSLAVSSALVATAWREGRPDSTRDVGRAGAGIRRNPAPAPDAPESAAARVDAKIKTAIEKGVGYLRSQQRPDGLRLPVHGQAERMVGEQPGRAGPVARRLGVPDGVGNVAVLD